MWMSSVRFSLCRCPAAVLYGRVQCMWKVDPEAEVISYSCHAVLLKAVQ